MSDTQFPLTSSVDIESDALVKGCFNGYVKKEPDGTVRAVPSGWHGAISALVHGYFKRSKVLRPRLTVYEPGSTVI